MSTTINVGGVYDLYREHVTNNAPTYTAPVSDDFRQNAVVPVTPTQPTRALCPAYAAQQTVDSWWAQLRQNEKQL